MANNSSTNYKSRELQSVPVGPKKGTHLKLRIGAAHPTELNPHGQVALIAVNVLGEDLSKEHATQFIQNINNERTESAIASICDDLSFSMYVEESMADMVRKMEQKKAKAVNGEQQCSSNKQDRKKNFIIFYFSIADERFEYARKLKLCMGALRSAGERLGRYSLAKRQAVQQEDFMTAKLRKEQIEMYRNAVFEQLQVEVLLEPNGVSIGVGPTSDGQHVASQSCFFSYSVFCQICPQNDAVSELYAQKPSLPSPPSLQDVASTLTTESTFASLTLSPKSVHRENSAPDHAGLVTYKPPAIASSPKRSTPSTPNSLRRRNRSVPRNSFDDYDEQAVPALRQ